MKKYFLIIIILIILVTAGYFIIQNQSDKNQSNDISSLQANKSGINGNDQMPIWDNDFLKASLTDLEIGQKILVMGTENSDGSVSANQIIIGNDETDFSQMSRNMMRPEEMNKENNGNNSEAKPMGQGQMPDFQNLSDEEREAMRQAMEERMTDGAKGRIVVNQTMARLDGEIIKKDEDSLVLQFEEGGSKIVFVSESTEIMTAK